MTEEEFLKNYNPEDFDRLAIGTDILMFSVATEQKENYRKLNQKFFSVLLVKRKTHPYKNKWCLPGGFVGKAETIEQSAKRILKRETNLSHIYMEQLYTFDSIHRDPRMRVVCTTEMALIDKNMLKEKLSEDAKWFNIQLEEKEDNIALTLYNKEEKIEIKCTKKLVEMTTKRYEYIIEKNDELAFENALEIITGIYRLKSKISYTDIVFNMMPKYFTLGDLQQVYEVILGKKLLDAAFRREISNKVEKTEMLETGAGHRPSALFKYKNNK